MSRDFEGDVSFCLELRALLEYEPTTGHFVWATVRTRRLSVGQRAGTCRKDGYRIISFSRRKILEHRLAWFFVYGEWPEVIDHRDGDPSNNAIANLRATTYAGNAQNKRRAQRNNSSGLLGVSWAKNAWLAQIVTEGTHRRVGLFLTKEAAYAAYLDAKRQLHSTCEI